jgi:hypothetical protein
MHAPSPTATATTAATVVYTIVDVVVVAVVVESTTATAVAANDNPLSVLLAPHPRGKCPVRCRGHVCIDALRGRR